MDTMAFLQYLRNRSNYYGQIAHIEHILPRAADYTELEEPLAAELQECLRKNGISSLYDHQAAAVRNARQGKNVMVATSSASGKTLCYNLAVLEAMLTEPDSRALYLFPTKALAQDQLSILHQLFCHSLFRT